MRDRASQRARAVRRGHASSLGAFAASVGAHARARRSRDRSANPCSRFPEPDRHLDRPAQRARSRSISTRCKLDDYMHRRLRARRARAWSTSTSPGTTRSAPGSRRIRRDRACPAAAGGSPSSRGSTCPDVQRRRTSRCASIARRSSSAISKQLVYYWFQQRGRVITNEYLVKWYLFVGFADAPAHRRRAGALDDAAAAAASPSEAADRATGRVRGQVAPRLERYIPD